MTHCFLHSTSLLHTNEQLIGEQTITKFNTFQLYGTIQHRWRNHSTQNTKQGIASKSLSLSERQIRRAVSHVTLEGDQGIVHKYRGKPLNRMVFLRLNNKLIEHYRTKYRGFGSTFAAGKLFEKDKIKIHQKTLHKWLIRSKRLEESM